MQSQAKSVEEYIAQVPDSQREAMIILRKTILENIPEGFSEEMSYGMIGYVVPHRIYPKGYKSDPKLPLPFLNLAAQKNYIALYHMGIYANPELLKWFTTEYPKYCKLKLDIGKGCIRFKKVDEIPYDLIGELVKKMEVNDWINQYKSLYLKS
ncbi:MAG TPA: hypothetical protein DCR40_05815 [Prolixibacteraceae bacterium]|nr:hypothetical protein [Prolixibacteraceae bacterium]